MTSIHEAPHWSVAYPLRTRDELWGVVAIEVQGRGGGQHRTILRQLQWGAAWIEVMLLRQRSRTTQSLLERASSTSSPRRSPTIAFSRPAARR